jgi:DNA-binding phage protein
MGVKRETQTLKRHQEIYEQYELVLAQHGILARRLSKSSIYDEVAEKTGWSRDHIYRVLKQIWRNGSKKTA